MADTSEMRVFAPEPIPIRINDSTRWWLRAVAVGAVAIPIAVGILQYIETVVSDRVDRVESAFTTSVAGLSSPSAAVRAEGLQELYRVSFTATPPRPSAGVASMFSMLRDWLRSKTEFHHLSRGRAVFRSVLISNEEKGPSIFADALGRIAAEWVQREREVGSDLAAYQFLLTGARLPFTEISGRDLSRLSFAGADLSNSNMSRANIQRSDFISARLTGAQLSGIDAYGASFQRASISGNSFRFAHCARCGFELASIQQTSFEGANLAGAKFDGATLRLVDFRGASLVGSSLRQAVLVNTNFSNSDLFNADFSGADLTGSDLRFAQNIGFVASWCGAKLPGPSLLPRDFKGTIKC